MLLNVKIFLPYIREIVWEDICIWLVCELDKILGDQFFIFEDFIDTPAWKFFFTDFK